MKSELKSPAFQFYPNDFLGSLKVASMTLEEVGLYTLLLCCDWNENGLPDPPESLAKPLRISPRTFKKLWKAVGENFVLRGGRWHNKRLDVERRKQLERKEKNRDAANQRWRSADDASAVQTQSVNDADAMQSDCSAFAVAVASPVPVKSTSSSVVGLVPPEYEPDLAEVLEAVSNPDAWIAELRTAPQGMHGPAATKPQIGRALRDYRGSGALSNPGQPPSLRHFRAFIKSAVAEDKKGVAVAFQSDAQGDALLALGKLRDQVVTNTTGHGTTKYIPTEVINSQPPEVQEALAAAGGARKLANVDDEKYGMMAAQFARAYSARVSKQRPGGSPTRISAILPQQPTGGVS